MAATLAEANKNIFKGLVFGSLVGDALGGPLEFLKVAFRKMDDIVCCPFCNHRSRVVARRILLQR